MTTEGPVKLVVPWGSGFNPRPGEGPLHALSESLQNRATTLVSNARDNPHVSRLVSGYEVWESNLRQEARQRLAKGFTPPASLRTFTPPGLHPFTPPGLPSAWDEWDTSRQTAAAAPSRALVPVSSTPRPVGGVGSTTVVPSSSSSSGIGSMKRPASESTFGHGGGGRMFGAGDGNPFEEYPGQQRMFIRKQSAQVQTAASLQEFSQALNTEAARNLEAVATSIIQGGKQAISHAQNSIQQTAANCQHNLSTLQTFLQNGLSDANSGAGLRQIVQRSRSGGGSMSQALQPFPSGNSLDAPVNSQAGAVVPWAMFPRSVWARERNVGDSSDEGGQQSSHAWFAPFQEYLDHLGDARGARRQHASLRDPGRQVAIVTTASLPWMTGTAVNPLLRAAYLANDTGRQVTLVLPWLSTVDQERVFPNNVTFKSPEEQETFVREWARTRTGLECDFKVAFYPGRYAAEKGSILPVGDVTSCIPDCEADVAVLEEPEHLNWYHHGRRWTDKFNHVVGVMHTNYLDYARREEGGQLKEQILKYVNSWMCRIHCHKVIKLSDAVQDLARQDTMFVHGVSPTFLRVGQKKALQASEETRSTSGATAQERPATWGKGAYFLGKVLWAKGYTELLERLKEHSSRSGVNVAVDVFGSGPDLKAVEDEAGKHHLNVRFNGARDHADEALQDYKVFINPSLSDVVATTTAEALAMGKFVVCADHPSNRFFKQFPNCLVYRNSDEFSTCLQKALSADPAPLSPADLHKLTWEAATERFLDVAEIKADPPLLESAFDNALAAVHNTLTGIEPMRRAAGAGTNTRDTPLRVTDYQPSDSDVGGMFDNHGRARQQQQKAVAAASASGGAASARGGAATTQASSTGSAAADGAAAAAADAGAADSLEDSASEDVVEAASLLVPAAQRVGSPPQHLRLQKSPVTEAAAATGSAKPKGRRFLRRRGRDKAEDEKSASATALVLHA